MQRLILHATNTTLKHNEIWNWHKRFPVIKLIKTQADLIAELWYRPLLYYATSMTDSILPIPLPLPVCARPIFLTDVYLVGSNMVQFYRIFQLFLNPFCASM